MSPEDQIVNALSRWLAGHLDNRRLCDEIEAVDGPLSDPCAESVEELLDELRQAGASRGGDVEVAVRETLEHLALG